jgi:hypothetical protein
MTRVQPLVLRSGAAGGASRRTLESARPVALAGASFEPPDGDPEGSFASLLRVRRCEAATPGFPVEILR